MVSSYYYFIDHIVINIYLKKLFIMEENFKKLEDDVVEFFKKVLATKSIATDINFFFLENVKQKKLIKLAKIPEQYTIPLNAKVLVTVNCKY